MQAAFTMLDGTSLGSETLRVVIPAGKYCLIQENIYGATSTLYLYMDTPSKNQRVYSSTTLELVMLDLPAGEYWMDTGYQPVKAELRMIPDTVTMGNALPRGDQNGTYNDGCIELLNGTVGGFSYGEHVSLSGGHYALLYNQANGAAIPTDLRLDFFVPVSMQNITVPQGNATNIISGAQDSDYYVMWLPPGEYAGFSSDSGMWATLYKLPC